MGTRVNGVDLSDGAALSDATPAALGVASAGVSTEASRADHVHALPTIPAVSSATPQPIGTATAGVSDDAARADHVHAPATRSPVPPACVARWLLTDTTSTIDDSVGAYDLAYSGAAGQQQRPSPWGKCLYTGGLAAGAGPKGAAALEPAAVSMLVWVNTFAYASPANYIVGKRQDDANWSGASPTNMAINIFMQTDGRPGSGVFGASGSAVVAPTGLEKRLPLNVWCRVVATYDTTDGLRLYVDGQLAGSAAAVGAILWGSGSWTIGVNNSGSGVAFPQLFDGFIRDVCVCDRVLTPAEILADYQQGIGHAP